MAELLDHPPVTGRAGVDRAQPEKRGVAPAHSLQSQLHGHGRRSPCVLSCVRAGSAAAALAPMNRIEKYTRPAASYKPDQWNPTWAGEPSPPFIRCATLVQLEACRGVT